MKRRHLIFIIALFSAIAPSIARGATPAQEMVKDDVNFLMPLRPEDCVAPAVC